MMPSILRVEPDLTSTADEWEYRHVKVSSCRARSACAVHGSETDSACLWAETTETARTELFVTSTTITHLLCEV